MQIEKREKQKRWKGTKGIGRLCIENMRVTSQAVSNFIEKIGGLDEQNMLLTHLSCAGHTYLLTIAEKRKLYYNQA